MNSGNQEIEVDGIRITHGTSLYDTEYDRVLWISNIDDTGVTVETVTTYEVDQPVGWTSTENGQVIADGTVFSTAELKTLIEEGRFEISP